MILSTNLHKFWPSLNGLGRFGGFGEGAGRRAACGASANLRFWTNELANLQLCTNFPAILHDIAILYNSDICWQMLNGFCGFGAIFMILEVAKLRTSDSSLLKQFHLRNNMSLLFIYLSIDYLFVNTFQYV